MNNEPVAWIDPKELDMDVSTSVTKNKQFESDIPLYVQPQKYCPSENNEAYEKGFIEGMAKQINSKVQQMVEGYTHPVKEQLTDEEIAELSDKILCYQIYDNKESGVFEFARAILRKAQIEVGCAECGVNDNNHALYCVTCAENYLKEKST